MGDPSEMKGDQLPAVSPKDSLVPVAPLQPTDHRTKPRSRYTVASFIKELEKKGVGRPSTYAQVVETLQSRGYVSLGLDSSGRSKQGSKSGSGSLVPSLAAFVVASLLEENVPNFVDPDFTARMEEALDDIAAGRNQVGLGLVPPREEPLESLSRASQEGNPHFCASESRRPLIKPTLHLGPVLPRGVLPGPRGFGAQRG